MGPAASRPPMLRSGPSSSRSSSGTPLRHNRRVKLVTAVVHSEDAGNLVDALLEKEFRATRLQSSGGFLKQGNATILVGVEDDQVDAVLEIVSANCHSPRAASAAA